MRRVTRYDFGTLRRSERTDENFLLFEGIATRAGVFDYRLPDGSVRRELRPREEVARADSLSTLGRKPITLLHPREDGQLVLVDPANAEKFVAGSVGELIDVIEEAPDLTTTRGPFVRVTGQVFRADAISAVDRMGMHALSCGYDCDLDETPGVTPDGERYDAIQRNIKYNHLAIVPRGRAGDSAVFRADAAAVQCDTLHPTGDEMTIEELKQQIAEYQKSAKAQQEMITSLRADMEDMKEDMDKADMDKMKADMQAKMDALRERAADMQSKMDAMAESYDAASSRLDEYEGEMSEMMKLLGLLTGDADMEDMDKAKRGDALDDHAAIVAKVHANVREQVKQRNADEELARQLRVDGDLEAMSDRDLLLAIAKKRRPDLRGDEADAYLRGLADAIEPDVEGDGYRKIGRTLNNARRTRGDSGEPRGRDRYLAHIRGELD